MEKIIIRESTGDRNDKNCVGSITFIEMNVRKKSLNILEIIDITKTYTDVQQD